jgi:glutamine synthetase
MHALKLDADYLLESYAENKDVMFQFNHNPFKNDIAGKAIEFVTDEESNTIEMPDALGLKPDYDTLRVASWLSKEAYIIADLYNPEDAT